MNLSAENDVLSIRDGRLYIEECDTVELAGRFGTPLFVVSETKLVNNLKAYTSAFEKYWPEVTGSAARSLTGELPVTPETVWETKAT